jgi:hypothetical protein
MIDLFMKQSQYGSSNDQPCNYHLTDPATAKFTRPCNYQSD